MAPYARLRCVAFLALALLSWTGAAQAQFPLVLEPKVVETASTLTFTVTSNGTIDLSGVTKQQVNFIDFFQGDSAQIDMSASKVDATARKLTVTASLDPGVIGRRQMHILFGDVIVSLKFTLVAPFVCPASCKPPRMCVDKQCVLPPTKCNPRCQLPRVCNEQLKRCELAQ